MAGIVTPKGRYFKAPITLSLRTEIILLYLYINNGFLEQAQRNETQMVIMLKMFPYSLSEDIRLGLSAGGPCDLLEDTIALSILQYIFHIFAVTLISIVTFLNNDCSLGRMGRES